MDIISNCVMCHFKQNIPPPQVFAVCCAVYSFKFPFQCLSQDTKEKFLALKAFKIFGLCGFLCSVNADMQMFISVLAQP